jgi:hypothetical protein
MPAGNSDLKPATSDDDVMATSKRFPPEAHSYDTDVTDKVVKRVKAEAEKVLEKDEWVVNDGVDKR